MIYDVSVPIANRMPVWPSDPLVKLTSNAHLSRDKSHTIRVTSIEMGSHTGTHIDAPWHFVEGGRKLDEIPLEWLVGAGDRNTDFGTTCRRPALAGRGVG
jgi:arylformamidase